MKLPHVQTTRDYHYCGQGTETVLYVEGATRSAQMRAARTLDRSLGLYFPAPAIPVTERTQCITRGVPEEGQLDFKTTWTKPRKWVGKRKTAITTSETARRIASIETTA